jgi:hypothetical protein
MGSWVNPIHKDDDILAAFKEWLRGQEAHWRDDTERKQFHFSPSIVAAEPLLDAGLRRLKLQRPSVGKRLFRTVFCGFIITVIGSGVFAWQSSDDRTKDVFRAWGISSWLSSVLPTNSLLNSDVAAEVFSKTLDKEPLQNAVLLPANQFTPASLDAGLSAKIQHQLDVTGDDVANVQRIVQMLAAKQEQTDQEIAKLQSIEQNVVQRLSMLPQPPPLRVPPQKNAARMIHSKGAVQPPSAP